MAPQAAHYRKRNGHRQGYPQEKWTDFLTTALRNYHDMGLASRLGLPAANGNVIHP